MHDKKIDVEIDDNEVAIDTQTDKYTDTKHMASGQVQDRKIYVEIDDKEGVR